MNHLLNCSDSAKKSDITSFELFVFNLFLIINYKTIKVCLFVCLFDGFYGSPTKYRSQYKDCLGRKTFFHKDPKTDTKRSVDLYNMLFISKFPSP